MYIMIYNSKIDFYNDITDWKKYGTGIADPTSLSQRKEMLEVGKALAVPGFKDFVKSSGRGKATYKLLEEYKTLVLTSPQNVVN